MYEFCPNCGNTLGQELKVGQVNLCKDCGKPLPPVTAAAPKVVIDQTDELLRSGTAARCPLCNQVVQLKTGAASKAYVPHMVTTPPRKMCPNSGKPVTSAPPPPPSAAPIPRPATSKDLSAYIKRDVIKVVTCTRDGTIKIEELTLEYLDKADRVRLQIDALRDILGAGFRMQSYPPALNRPQLAVWANAKLCVVAGKNPQGGYQEVSAAEIQQIVNDFQQWKDLFFA